MIYLISSGRYTDYGVCFLIESDRGINEDDFRVYWLEAIKRKTEYMDDKLECIAKYLNVPKQLSWKGYTQYYDNTLVQKAMDEVGYEFKSEDNCLEEILTEQGFRVLPYTEYNVDDF